jgi:prepilin peptidase CpaA
MATQMIETSVQNAIWVSGVILLTSIAMATDLRARRIPNWLTGAGLLLGLGYQGIFVGASGLQDGTLGFLIGFGLLFVFWLCGSGGGGDVKLMGALGMWLGMSKTLVVLISSTILIAILTMVVIVCGWLTKGWRTSRPNDSTKRLFGKGTASDALMVRRSKGRQIMPYAVPVALATWLILFVTAMSHDSRNIRVVNDHKLSESGNRPVNGRTDQ